MSKLFSKRKPSRTANNAAWFRACSHKDFPNQKWGPDFIAECFLSFTIKLLTRTKIFREKANARINEATPGIYEYIIARTLFFDEVFTGALKESFPQVVLLGAGYDSRGIRFKHLNNGARIIELDMAPTQNLKIKYLKRNKIEIPNNLIFVPIDFNNQSLESVLTSAGYRKGERTLFIWEGVTMYIDPQSVKDTLTFIRQCSTSDSLLAFDFVISFPEEDGHKYYGAERMLQFMKEKHKNEPFTFSIDVRNIDSFLDEWGHKIIRHLNHDQVETTYLKKDDGSSLGKPNGLFNFIITSPEM